MIIDDPASDRVEDEMALLAATIPLAGLDVVEPGCGTAQKTRWIADQGAASVTALEVDTIQHQRNLAQPVSERIRYLHAGAEAMPLEAESCDLVVMFKSLHHVPVERMRAAIGEVARILRPGGLAWISEPVYRGDFNEILRLFHDERVVREAAFNAIRSAVSDRVIELKQQLFFDTVSEFSDFSEFDARILSVTHTDHRLSDPLRAEVEARFNRHLGDSGARFRIPVRVDLLQRPLA
jgi:SAM-dependent methyltransferase